MQLHIFSTASEMTHAVADWLVNYVAQVLQSQERFTLALSGGSTPKALHKLLAAPPYRDRIAWNRLHIFWGDERYVPFADEQNNARMAYDTLLNHVPVPDPHIHVMRTDVPPERSAADYGKILHQYFDGHNHTFDLVLLGMGDDGHTLSLFPETEVIGEKTAWVKSLYLEKQRMYRITLTTPVINRAACVAFLVSGEGKAATLNEVLNGPYRPEQFPAQSIQPENGQLIWFVDEAAAQHL